MKTKPEILDARVDRSGGQDACWPWTGALNNHGYGVFELAGKFHLAHRVAYEQVHGPLGGLCALHRCDNRPCCNPRHLFAGTRGDNIKDCIAKGRHRQSYGRLKLTDDQVREIRTTPGTHVEAARRYGVHPTLICRIRSGKHRATPIPQGR